MVGCSTAPSSAESRASLRIEADDTVAKFQKADDSMSKFFNTAEGWAVFPSVGKGGIGIGGAYGRGLLYEGGEAKGYCDLTQATIGFQLGGQVYSEIVFFKDEAGLRNFRSGDIALSAQVSAVAATAGASADADYKDGVVVFTMGNTGLMYEASVGGQAFSYIPFDGTNN